MEQTLSTDPVVEARVVVRYDPGCPGECFLSYRSVNGRAVLCITFGDLIPRHAALMQARAMVPYYRGDRTVVSS